MYGMRMLANSVRVGAFSTIWPAYMTAISSVRPATTPRSWVTSTMAMWRSALLGGEQVEDLGLDGDVEGGGGLVGEEQLRAAGQGDGDRHPLAHAAGELVRVLAEPSLGVGDADRVEQLQGLLVGFVLGDVEVVAEALGDLPPDLHDRVERGHRVLEHHRHLGAPERPELVRWARPTSSWPL